MVGFLFPAIGRVRPALRHKGKMEQLAKGISRPLWYWYCTGIALVILTGILMSMFYQPQI